jgi:hypothetical protein
MDELTMVRDLGRETPEPDGRQLAAGRDALLAEAGRSRRRKRTIYSWAAAGLAAGVVAVLTLPGSAGPPPRPEPGLAVEYSMRPASQVLDLAATAALAEPDLQPRPDQFLYRADKGPDGKLIYEIWKSVDGTRNGEVVRYDPGATDRIPLEACPANNKNLVPEQGGCLPDPAYLPDLPSDVEGMLAYLRERNAGDTKDATTNSTAKDIWELSAAHYLRPAQRAALFRAAATVAGLKVVDHATDAAGRKGTGVAWTYAGGPEMMWIFDPKTFTYLGTPTETSTTAIVDRVGETS